MKYMPAFKVSAIVLLATALAACSTWDNMSRREQSAVGGAAVGGVAGSVVGGGVLSTVGGAAIGGVIGDQIGKNNED